MFNVSAVRSLHIQNTLYTALNKLNKRNMTTNKRNQGRTGQLSTHNIFLSNSCRSDAVYPKIN